MAIDQYGNHWALEFKAGVIWARGVDDDGKACVRQVWDREIVIDWSKPKALRRLTLTNDPLAIDLNLPPESRLKGKRQMGNPNSKRARRRLRARLDADPNMVYWMGRWMVRNYTEKRIDYADGSYSISSNETWHEPHVLDQMTALTSIPG